MDGVEGLKLPAFFSYYEKPVKFVTAADGGMTAWKLDRDNGGWQPADELIERILFAGGDDIDSLSREEFIQLTEYERGRYLRGEGPVFALYETVSAINDVWVRERRYPTQDEVALVRGIQRRTFVMFEEELQRAGDPGADPSLSDN